MKVIKEGHLYEVENFDNPETEGQKIQFIEKEGFETGELVTVIDGTTNEELIKVVIDRIDGLNKKHHCVENDLTLHNLREALKRQEMRVADRKQRGVYGTNKV